MQIKVKIPVDVEPTDKILRIKEVMEEREGIPPSQQRLIFAGKQTDDEQSVEAHKLQPGDTLHLVLTLRGG